MFNSRFSLLVILFLLVGFSSVFAQKNSIVVLNSTQYEVASLYFDGVLHVDIKNLSDKAHWKYFYNFERNKIEIKFSAVNLVFAANNPYIVVNEKPSGERVIIQLLITSKLFKNTVYIPFVYAKPYLEQALKGSDISPTKSPDIAKLEPEKPSKPVEKETPTPQKTNEKNTVESISVQELANGTLVHVTTKKPIERYRDTLNNNVVVIRLRGVQSEESKFAGIANKGLVKKVKVNNLSQGTEIIITSTEDLAAYEVFPEGSSRKKLLITLHSKSFGKAERDKVKKDFEFDVVVIDPGHGGKDAGAIGVNKTKEKDVNLDIALKLGALLKKNLPELKIVYTRDDDTFVELYKRGKIANENKGKLFISLHCNSTPNKGSSANGFEFYLLRPGKTQDAISIAETENSVIKYEDNPENYKQLTDENFILVSMAHSAYMTYSEQFGGLLDKHFRKQTILTSRGVKQAGFYVLVGASMPGILIESGFLSNSKEAEYLASEKGQTDIAKAIFEAIKDFRSYYTSQQD